MTILRSLSFLGLALLLVLFAGYDSVIDVAPPEQAVTAEAAPRSAPVPPPSASGCVTGRQSSAFTPAEVAESFGLLLTETAPNNALAGLDA